MIKKYKDRWADKKKFKKGQKHRPKTIKIIHQCKNCARYETKSLGILFPFNSNMTLRVDWDFQSCLQQ